MLTQPSLSKKSIAAHLIKRHISNNGQVWYEVKLEGASTSSWIREDYMHVAIALIPFPTTEVET